MGDNSLERRMAQLELSNEVKNAVREEVAKLKSELMAEIERKVAKEVANKAKSEGSSCFPANALVQLEDGTTVAMADLLVGQNVLSSFSNGKAKHSIVYFFAHQDDQHSTEFISILTPRHKIKLTPDHHIYIVDGGRQYNVPARNVKVGDKIMVVNKDNSRLEEEIVTELFRSTDVGIYAPITMTGTIIVNNVFASCYVDVVPPQIAHPLLWPGRQLYQLAPSLSAATNTHGKDGMPIWVKWFMDNVLN